MAELLVNVGKKKSDILNRVLLLNHAIDRVALDLQLPEDTVQAVVTQELRSRLNSGLTPDEQIVAQEFRIGFITEQAIRLLGAQGTDIREKIALLEIIGRQNAQRAQLYGLDGLNGKGRTGGVRWSPAELDRILNAATVDEQKLLAAGDIETLTAVARRAGIRA